jgi:CDP-diacylglycerol--glycerol-3-phosphate 3-phosphatidyltransferase
MIDLSFSTVLVAGLLVVAVAYGTRVALRGRARHPRSDADGGSLLLGKSVMEMGYWLLAPVARLLARRGVSADTVTTMALVPGLGAGIMAGTGHLGLACALGAAAAICDLLDGLVARERGCSAKSGELLDATVDRYVETFLLGGLAVHFRAHQVLLVLTILALLGTFMVSYGSARIQSLGIPAPRGFMRRAERAVFILAPCGVTPLFSKWLMAGHSEIWLREWPLIVGLVVVAVGANLSAFYRLRISLLRLQGRSGRATRFRAVANPSSLEGDPTLRSIRG